MRNSINLSKFKIVNYNCDQGAVKRITVEDPLSPGRSCTYTVGKYTTINEKHFDPTDYTLLFTHAYTCIVDAKPCEKEKARKDIAKDAAHMYHKYFKVKENTFNAAATTFLQIGAKVHLHSRDGMYTVLGKKQSGFIITCAVWQRRYKSGELQSSIEFIPYNDFKCYAGGLHNWTPVM
jgi:hypothetical protein